MIVINDMGRRETLQDPIGAASPSRHLAWPWHSRRVAGVGCDDAAKLVSPADRAVVGGPEVDLQHVVPDVPPTMRALGAGSG